MHGRALEQGGWDFSHQPDLLVHALRIRSAAESAQTECVYTSICTTLFENSTLFIEQHLSYRDTGEEVDLEKAASIGIAWPR